MTAAPDALRRVGTVARLAGRALQRRWSGEIAPYADDRSFRETLAPWLAGLPTDLLADHRFHYLPARRPPWFDSGIDVVAGDKVTLLSDGRVYLSRLLDLWVAPSIQLWCRIGEQGPVFRGTRSTHTFTAMTAGRLWVASYFPGQWADTAGRLATPESAYAKVSGGLSVCVLKWRPGTEVTAVFRRLAKDTRVPGLVLAEAERHDQPVPTPEHWEYLWSLGPGEIYRSAAAPDGRPTICCHTHGDVGILRREARLPLVPGTRLAWSWRVDELPIDVAEDTLPSHDYVSIAVEFDDGQDITYYWSARLPAGTVYRCPLPTWKDKETHVVARSGRGQLGAWLAEERDLYADYARIIGGPAREIVRVWLIANSLFQRGHGRCEYASISVESGGRTLSLL
ncbi:MAG: DUF3047 domain-containing protein [Steroidobacteraceae bacterium]